MHRSPTPRHRRRSLPAATLGALALAIASAAHAQSAASAADGCELDGAAGRVSVLANDFETTNVLAEELRGCARDGLEIEVNLNTEVRDIQVAALSARPAAYTGVLTANGSVVPLLNEGLVRPLDALVDEFGAELTERQRITIGGEVVAIAFMANAQHLVYRTDALEALGLDAPPTTWDGIVEATADAREAGRPAATLWWDGFTIARNADDADTVATGTRVANAHPESAV